ncbi:AT-rich interactive domain-containing protein [Quillaja saponaria]|uniref:AT-rich interactive domain-containing protein n=1 Tax=Quillaja saponaria TaxID=32244 RepID=A0AAD7L666_QUISA|nr:AT-rich interactive domain-containing protein [Quillaja saponaria]
MAGWSSLTNGSGLDCFEIGGSCQGNSCFLTLDHLVNDGSHDSNDYKVKQKRLFYKILSVYLKESSSKGLFRPLPVMLGDGKHLDLYKLFRSVKEKGGFILVSKKGLWATVVEELNLDLEILALVKLTYDKYLNDLEGWFRKNCGGKNFKHGHYGCSESSKFLPFELEKEFRGLLSVGLGHKTKWKCDEHVHFESKRIGKYNDGHIQKSDSSLLDIENEHIICEDVRNTQSDDDEKKFNHHENDVVILDYRVAKEFDNRKRKREASSGMLNWVRRITNHPLDPSFEPIPDPSKWNEYEGKELWGQALRAREALLMKRHVKSNCERSLLQKLKMHPAMYEDDVVDTHQPTRKLRCSERLPTLVKTHLCSCCNSCSATTRKFPWLVNKEVGSSPMKRPHEMVNLLDLKPIDDPSGDNHLEKQVSVGPLHQAEVPVWIGVVSESDSKWIGTQIWPLKNRERNDMIKGYPIGKGRQEMCSCQFKCSVECVRFHVNERRIKLKLELGSAFFYWRFDCMGEEVLLQWTTEEERRFKAK